MDPNEKREEMDHEEITNGVSDEKSCVDCKTTKTPLWRSGPAGPKSLCNACGIRYRKKRVGTKQDFNRDPEKKKKKSKTKDHKETSNKRRKVSEDLRTRVMAFSKEVVLLQRPRSPVKRRMAKSNHNGKKIGEVEQAAVLLMAMSCGHGSVFA